MFVFVKDTAIGRKRGALYTELSVVIKFRVADAHIYLFTKPNVKVKVLVSVSYVLQSPL